jgi:hypothetical protein
MLAGTSRFMCGAAQVHPASIDSTRTLAATSKRPLRWGVDAMSGWEVGRRQGLTNWV